MTAENSNKLKLKTYTSTRKNIFTLVTLQSFSISGVTSAEKMEVEVWNNLQTFVWLAVWRIPPVIQTPVNLSIFNLHLLSWYSIQYAETGQG